MPEGLQCWAKATESEQLWNIYVTLGGSEVGLLCFSAMPADEQRWLIYLTAGGTP